MLSTPAAPASVTNSDGTGDTQQCFLCSASFGFAAAAASCFDFFVTYWMFP
jgi:hypothetical protein